MPAEYLVDNCALELGVRNRNPLLDRIPQNMFMKHQAKLEKTSHHSFGLHSSLISCFQLRINFSGCLILRRRRNRQTEAMRQLVHCRCSCWRKRVKQCDSSWLRAASLELGGNRMRRMSLLWALGPKNRLPLPNMEAKKPEEAFAGRQ